jgi:inner membrane protein
MDTITHGFAGSVLSRSASDRLHARVALLLGAVAGMFPDADYFFLHGRLDYLANHRGWSHSFVYLPLFALGLALAARAVFRKSSLWTLWIFAGVGIASHIVLDWITSFGTMFFVPFSRRRYSLDWVFILDPFFTAIVLLGLVLSIAWRARSRQVAVASSVLLAAYVTFCAVLHHRALATWRALDHPAPGATVAALPQFLSPFRWLALTEEGSEVHAAFFDIGPFAKGSENPQPPVKMSQLFSSLSDYYPPPARARIQKFTQASESPALAAARALPDARIYLAFARFPLVTVRAEPGGVTAVTC